MRKMELLAPAGDIERLRMAVAYGADAVYLAGNDFGMRSFAGNFSPEELKTAVELCRARQVRVHVTCNTMPRNREIACLPEWLEQLEALGVAADWVCHATGTGKTVTAVLDAKRLGGRTLFLAHTQELVEQAAKTFQALWPDAAVGRYLEDVKEPENHVV